MLRYGVRLNNDSIIRTQGEVTGSAGSLLMPTATTVRGARPILSQSPHIVTVDLTDMTSSSVISWHTCTMSALAVKITQPLGQ